MKPLAQKEYLYSVKV